MRYLALATGFDGTVATDGRIAPEVADALARLRTSGRRAILVTGRRLDDLLTLGSCAPLFDFIVAENGGVLYRTAGRESTRLGPPPAPELVRLLEARNVAPLEVGEVMLAAPASQRAAVQDAVWELGLEVQVLANRSTVLVLPAGINKATGMERALRELGLSRHEVVGIGDGENDHSFLARCECPVAVANAVPAIARAAALRMPADNGAGVVQLIEQLIADDLERMEGRIERHLILLGRRGDGTPVQLPPYGHNVLIAGPSGSGKSTLTAGLVERLIGKDYQVCIVDPEGDYAAQRDVVALGNPARAPSVSEILAILEDPAINLSINLLGIPLHDRPEFFAQLIPNLQAMRSRTGRPHWLVLDEAHHMLPDTWGHAGSALPRRLGETILVTVHPDHVAPAVLAPIDVALAIGERPEETLGKFARAANKRLHWPAGLGHEAHRVVAWFVRDGQGPFALYPEPARAERIRHFRKYAEGDLRWHSFYFRGPEGRQNLKAQNLQIFCQIAEGIDEDTWMYHLCRGDYSRWFRYAVRDAFLADEAERIERRTDLPPWESRRIIIELVRSRYTLPA